MRYYGVLSATVIYILLLVCSALFDTSLFINNLSFGINLSVLVIVCIVFYLLSFPKYKIDSASVKTMYLPATVFIIHCSCNLLNDTIKGNHPPELAKDDWSGVVIAPILFVITILWGWVFDWKKNKITKLQTINE